MVTKSHPLVPSTTLQTSPSAETSISNLTEVYRRNITPPLPNDVSSVEKTWKAIETATKKIVALEEKRKGSFIFTYQDLNGRECRGFTSSIDPVTRVLSGPASTGAAPAGPVSAEAAPAGPAASEGFANFVGGTSFPEYPIIASRAPNPSNMEEGELLAKALKEQNKGNIVVNLLSRKEIKKHRAVYSPIADYFPNITLEFSDEQLKELAKNENPLLISFPVWGDGLTIDPNQLSELVSFVDKAMKMRLETYPEGRLWVHCKAGVGRTGTLITALLLKYEIKNHLPKDLEDPSQWLLGMLQKLILTMRSERGSWFVQTEDQFILLYQFGLMLLQGSGCIPLHIPRNIPKEETKEDIERVKKLALLLFPKKPSPT